MNHALLPIAAAFEHDRPSSIEGGDINHDTDRIRGFSSDNLDDQTTVAHEIAMAWGLIQMYGEQVLLHAEATNGAPMTTLPERLAALLLEQSNREDGVIQNIGFQALATALGAYRETVASLLRAFKRQGVIELGYNRISILDVDALEELAR